MDGAGAEASFPKASILSSQKAALSKTDNADCIIQGSSEKQNQWETHIYIHKHVHIHTMRERDLL